MRTGVAAFGFSMAVVTTLGGCGAGGGGGSAMPQRGMLVAIADGDVGVTSVADGFLFGPDGSGAMRGPDTLAVYRLPLPEPEAGSSTTTDVAWTEVENSVFGPPPLLHVTDDGSTAFVLASRGGAQDGDKMVGDLPVIGRVTAVDLAGVFSSEETPARGLRTLDQIDLGPGSSSMDLHPDGRTLVVGRAFGGVPELVFVDFARGEGFSVLLESPVVGLNQSQPAGIGAVAFDPTGTKLAVTVLGMDQALFYEFERDGLTVTLTPWGEALQAEKFAYTAGWSADGEHFFVSSLMWGPDVEGFRIGSPAGRLGVVELAEDTGPETAHSWLGHTEVGVSPEGLAVSPRGDLVVTGNMRLSFLPESDPRFTRGGSLSLLRFDRGSGALEPLGEFVCGSVPEGLAFDRTGRFLFVTDFEEGGVQIWRVVGSGAGASLEFTGVTVGVGSGAHGVVLTR